MSNEKIKTEMGLCLRCKKNQATMQYAESSLSLAHGFMEEICQECYDKQMEESDWYKKGKAKTQEKELEFLKSISFKIPLGDKVWQLQKNIFDRIAMLEAEKEIKCQ